MSSHVAKPRAPRKLHSQLPLTFRTWGGRRAGAGRPPKGARAGEKHLTRPQLDARNPVHVVLRIERDVGNLRVRDLWRAIREATITAAKRENFHLVHASVQRTHLHLIVEATDRVALSRGMQGFGISAAKHLNRTISKRRGVRRKGRVISDRYHARILNSPKSVRNAVAYVVNNWRHHREDRGHPQRTWHVDPFSTGVFFDGWAERANSPILFRAPPTYEALITWRPTSWLLARGWRKHGAISIREVPGAAHAVE